MARLYANENFPQPVVEELRRLGHDVMTSHESGQAGQALSDEKVLAFAIAEARILIRSHSIASTLFACIKRGQIMRELLSAPLIRTLSL
ncbi:MAG: DUF5615 family PIN-like protein [Anaerolineae bacterium]|nr:DUF5615 family PIN-like protein [Anaerolineae bacterium]